MSSLTRTLPLAFVLSGSFFYGRDSHAGEPEALDYQEIDALHSLIKPHPGESRWMEIDWYPSVWEARQKAAAEGKPIFLMAGSGGAPVAGC